MPALPTAIVSDIRIHSRCSTVTSLRLLAIVMSCILPIFIATRLFHSLARPLI
ncbi:hypothetical protein FIBSPDRAFT_870971 [Athelia psychrophila]|uniref:Uncharacterized protein n=1 Tax=Athelia psychrophila TaxID=1759441 RepID=A0A166AL26_9AGAM|nr:hypothetical protein FIBSPDRAFT_870971 [Fibularhizoctonia sp. CBS 109695]